MTHEEVWTELFVAALHNLDSLLEGMPNDCHISTVRLRVLLKRYGEFKVVRALIVSLDGTVETLPMQ